MAPIVKLEVSERQKRELLRMVRAQTSSPRAALRARMMLLRSKGKTQKETALEVGVAELAVHRWEKRFRTRGIAGLEDTVGHHRKDPVPPETVRRVW